MGWEQTITLNVTYKGNIYWLGCSLGPPVVKSIRVSLCWKIKLFLASCLWQNNFLMRSSWEWFWNYQPLEKSLALLGISWKIRKDISISNSQDTTSSSQCASRPGMDTRTSSLAYSSHPNPKPRLRGRTPKLSLECQRYQWNLKNTPTHVWSPRCREAPRVCAIPIQCPGQLSWCGRDMQPTPAVWAWGRMPVFLWPRHNSSQCLPTHSSFSTGDHQDFSVTIHRCIFKHLSKKIS